MAEKISANRTVSPKEAKAAIRKCVKKQRPVFMWGPPGIGKSDIIKQLGDEQGRESWGSAGSGDEGGGLFDGPLPR